MGKIYRTAVNSYVLSFESHFMTSECTTEIFMISSVSFVSSPVYFLVFLSLTLNEIDMKTYTVSFIDDVFLWRKKIKKFCTTRWKYDGEIHCKNYPYFLFISIHYRFLFRFVAVCWKSYYYCFMCFHGCAAE